MTVTIIGIIGYTGRMGQAIARTIEAHPTAALGGGITRRQSLVEQESGKPQVFTDNPEELFPHCDVIIDFSHASVTPMFARIASDHGKPFVSGTTGLDDAAYAVLKDVAQKIPVLHATNMSLSLVVAKQMARLGAKILKDQDYDVSILDKHHRWKKDSPSGTALSLGQAILEANEGLRKPTYASLRTGAIIGEHEVLFAGAGESIAVQHTVTDRRVFARGAVQAAVWLAKQPSGYYSMENVLGL